MNASATQDCLFCKIVAGEIPGEKVTETDRVYAFRDINPQAPTHVLVVPKEHHENAAATAAADPESLAEMFTVAAGIADSEGLDGHRLVFNSGASAGQVVFHAHLHVLGGRGFAWPPG
jgi:histidine triad (HIT) family protein